MFDSLFIFNLTVLDWNEFTFRLQIYLILLRMQKK